MRNAALFIALILAAPARAQFDAPHPPPDWMERGFEAAIADPSSIQGALGSSGFCELAEFVPSARAGAVIDKLLPFLGDEDRDLQRAAEESLARIAAGGQAAVVIDKLLPLLGDLRRDLRHAAAEALGQIAPGERAGMVIDRLLPLLGDDFDPVCGIARGRGDRQAAVSPWRRLRGRASHRAARGESADGWAGMCVRQAKLVRSSR